MTTNHDPGQKHAGTDVGLPHAGTDVGLPHAGTDLELPHAGKLSNAGTTGHKNGGTTDWAVSNTWDSPDWTVDELIEAKEGRTVSVVLPALNEERTVAEVVASIRPLVGSLVDELVVLDSGSSDGTVERARAAGARVVTREQAVPELEPVPGKGEVLWRSLAVTSGDLVAFVDSDLIDPDPMFVPRLLGPLLTVEGMHLVKAYYRRPLRQGETVDHNGGGRVTELVARPLLAALRPQLSKVLQPLGGEYAGTRELLTSVPFAPGYGVEIGLLLDTYDLLGLSAIGQVDLGVRTHRNRPLADLGVMSRQILGTVLGRSGIRDSGAALTQFPLVGNEFTTLTTEVSLSDRPPMNTLRPVGVAA
ncbi:glucosyl-3-phosphoglycerate synthase [Nocardia terpenica]|uniref:glucosyl-3-phosphoglycerate synthase n=1 Tax=Nocardia terpenica TaxID=455432 RepID=UPI001895BBE8|nr:glucosyl-3-phosphoglycerate synthase [Nocardia terpenica]MBF6060848.1 glucosyl-3-phosphoglycerate synthase [Nocardia terpenica]MBF6104108.1 glucosyl-3-phosphoglycerate synthase [Nocardia terpenica]MBF6111518.1 glucosyl-3-phosphoglycerate synthase [Nocardia terpenica]MBF6118329.1 glucosyl-3-phosphoglycerate synthase [Nocardia terpenica]MBF6155651.1 glucosyl-3-phosphoglycerate synthase [Nocardia terpenica]